MRKFLAIVVCKLGRFVGKLVGKGSSMPGKFALKICPDILKRVQLPPHIIAVTGSNGKTSTVEMIATVLRAQGKHVIYNAEGSNQVEGVTTLILTHATLGGKVNADVLLVSQTVTQKDVHIQNRTELIELAEAEGVRDKYIFCCGGARITHALAKELGYDAGFGAGTYADDVATFCSKELVRRLGK